MGLWDLYFIAKLFLYFGHYMGFHPGLNLAFAVFLAVPIPETHDRRKRLHLYRQLIAVPVGISLFYYDTWLPPFARALAQLTLIGGFSAAYLAELAERFFNPPAVLALLLIFAMYFVAARRIRVSSVIFVVMLATLFSFGHGTPRPEGTDAAYLPAAETSLGTQLADFYGDESERAVSFPAPPKSDAPFDIIVLQICSLSWDDLDFTGQRDNPLFKRFDIVFTHFNSVASYSGPAAIRLLRGSCGQPAHKALYDPAPAQCLTFNNLARIGFQEQFAMNHDGHYGGFLSDVRDLGGLKATLFDAKSLPPYLQSFDGSPVREDFPVLSRWWEARVKLPAPRVALFYNSISLHDGNYYSGRRGVSMKIYPSRLAQLLQDMDRFLSTLQASGRRAVVVFIPEHGASMRGDRMQIAGMREIPTPRITNVPVGVKLIGAPDNPPAQPLLVTEPTSYLAVSQLLANFLTVTPFGKQRLALKDYVRGLPETNFVSENDDVVVMQRGQQYYLRTKGEDWMEYEP